MVLKINLSIETVIELFVEVMKLVKRIYKILVIKRNDFLIIMIELLNKLKVN